MKKSFMKRLVALALVIVSLFSMTAMASADTMYVDGDIGVGKTVRIRKNASSSSSSNVLVNVTYGTALTAESYNSTWHAVTYTDPVTKRVYNGYTMSSFLSSSIPSDCAWIARYGTRAHKETNTKYTGADNLQRDLNAYFAVNDGNSYSWYPLTVDGYCGANTVKAIKKFQQLEGLSADGIAGNMTKEYLYKIVDPK